MDGIRARCVGECEHWALISSVDERLCTPVVLYAREA